MLILSRRIGESLKIGSDITVMIISVKGNQVRIGVSAPRDTPSSPRRGCAQDRARECWRPGDAK